MSLKQNILILNYKTSNIKSIFNAIKLYDDEVKISSNYKDLKTQIKLYCQEWGILEWHFKILRN